MVFCVNNSLQVMPAQSLERTDEICIAGSPLTPRRVSEVRADTGGLGRSKLKILGQIFGGLLSGFKFHLKLQKKLIGYI